MNRISPLIVVLILIVSGEAVSSDQELCSALKGFAHSVGIDESRSIEFQTSWGKNFKGEKEEVVFTKRCNFHEYEQAKKVCSALMGSSSSEFPYLNLKRVLTCLSPKTKFAKDMEIDNMAVSFYVGGEERGSLVEVSLGQEPSVGANQLKIVVEGY